MERNEGAGGGQSTGELASLFPAGDYRFHLGLRHAEPGPFFSPRAGSDLLRERRRWIEEDAERYTRLLPEGAPLLSEFSRQAGAWGGPPVTNAYELGMLHEPDVLFLSPDREGVFRLWGGALCFPTGWSLAEKLGQPMSVVHGPVPGLNDTLGARIHQFMSRLRPGGACLRDNWGLAATDELNLHPARSVPVPAAPVELSRLWLRVERQALLALQSGRGIVFGIRIELHRLDTLAGTPAGWLLARSLRSMSSEVAEYKRVAEVRGDLAALLEK